MMNLFYKAKKLGATDFGKSKIKGKNTILFIIIKLLISDLMKVLHLLIIMIIIIKLHGLLDIQK